MSRLHHEHHAIAKIGWLRAAVLGANDGIVSTASLIVGVAAAGGTREAILVAGGAGLVAGAMSMAAGEFVSVSSQADTEAADLARERAELKADPALELDELTDIYIDRGLDAALARRVAETLTAKDALTAHARDELHISRATRARPGQAALASAASFAMGAILPLATLLIAPASLMAWMVSIASLAFLALLGAVGAAAGGAPMAPGVLRVTFWGAIAMALTFGAGHLFGAL